MEESIDGKVIVTTVDDVTPHPNADRLELAHVKGWQCVVRKGELKPGALVVYFPIDSVLPADLEADLFPPDSKITLTNHRIRTIKIRKAISQGMVVPAHSWEIKLRIEEPIAGMDVTSLLGVTHYEPPVKGSPQQAAGQSRRRNPWFKEYTKISHFKNYPDLFEEGEEVIVTEKIHGTNFRAGWVKSVPDSWWKRIKNFLGLLPEWEFLYGSHHVQYNSTKSYNGFYPKNVYRETVKNYMLETRIPKGFVVYGEIYGDGIQKGYHYGLKDGKHRLAIFDVLVTNAKGEQHWLDWMGVKAMSSVINVPTVPVVYEGPFSAAKVPSWESGPSLINDRSWCQASFPQEHREGVVVKPKYERECWIGRKMLRSINPEYLLVCESDFH